MPVEGKYNLDYLKRKGFFKNYGELEIEGDQIIWDQDNYLVYVEVKDLENLKKIHNKLKKEYVKLQYFYYYIPKENKVKVFKRGYSAAFTYSNKISKKDIKKSKEDKLNKFSPENLNVFFDTKDVMDKFYNDLWKIRLKMAKSIKKKIKDKDKLLVVQHFIDRLAFLYFLFQLGVVNVKYNRGKDSCEYVMNKENTKKFFEFLSKNLDDCDLQKLLNSIFFEGLGNENKVNSNGYVDVSISIGEWKFDISVPYLNGGLFREGEVETITSSKVKESDIKFEGIKELIKYLNEYNWIVGESSNDEESVLNLTPEILGHVYEKFVVGLENLEEDINLDELKFNKNELRYGRKKIGAYYTPEEITYYICENTIIPYLLDKLGIKYDETLNLRVSFDDFVEKATKSELEKALEILDNIKVLDPACGSGHFLVSAGYLICDLKEAIYNKLNKDFDEYKVVKEIILNNLYGVDISEPAVEIAKLRLWLWLVSKLKDKDSIEPLPNLEYNLRCGNSLIGWVDEPIIYTLNYAYNDRIDGIFKGLIAFSKNIKERKDLKKARDLLKSKEGNILDKYVEAFYILYKIYRKCSGDKAIQLKEILEEIRSSIYESVNSAFLRYINEKIKPNYNLKKPPVNKEDFEKLNPFHWRVDFGWIIKKGGFDVVIGNPPYGNLLSNSEKSIVRNIYRSDTSEIAGLFVERVIKFLKDKGYLSYIITFAITFNKKLSKTREILKNNFEKIYISSFDRDKCRFFEGMSQSVSILKAKIKNTSGGVFYTSKMFREMPKSLDDIKYSPTNKYLLLDNGTIGNRFDMQHRLPKIGESQNLKILNTLLKFTDKVKNVINIGNTQIWIRTSGNYWYNAWDRKPYESSEIKSIAIKEGWSEFIIMLMNSSLFYWWFRIYGDGRHMNMDILEAFPLPNEELVKNDAKLLECIRKFTMNKLFNVFDSKRNRFNTSEVKGYLDLIDLIIGKKYYNLQPYEILHILNTDYEVRGEVKLISPFYELISYLSFLTLNTLNMHKNMINFIDKQIIDPLIYELYFKEKFHEDKLYSEPKEYLLEEVSKYLKSINYDRYAELYWKKQLEGNLSKEEEEELKQLEEQNLKTIKEVYEKIKNDEKIKDLINKIKNHEWVKVIEGKL